MSGTAANHDSSPLSSRGRAAQTFFFSILLAAIISTPLAAGVVAFRWVGIDHARLLAEAGNPALWSARTFLAYFDLFALAAWVPCACCISFVNARLRAAYGIQNS
jgi:hypothetical protein